MRNIHHALVLNFHQPAGNLEHLLSLPNPLGEDGWEGKEILYAMDRMPRMLWAYEDRARVHLALSGTLLETLSDKGFQERHYGVVKCGDLLWYLQNEKLFSVLGTAYYHAVLPLVPEEDWPEQLKRWWGIASHLFWRQGFQGYWPAEMGFCMEMIPLLARLGYRYVLVDSEHVEAITPMSWHELRYRPHLARFGDAEIIVVVRDRDLSNAQESGMEPDWFAREVGARTQFCDFEPLVTTCTDGDNGGWFRNFRDRSNFWNVFYLPLLDAPERGEVAVRPTFIHDYLDRFGAEGEVRVRKGAWNTGWHSGLGFTQWTGSAAQREALERVADTSRAIHETRTALARAEVSTRHIEEALWRLLRAETSCHFFWGEAWLDKAHLDLDEAWIHLEQAMAALEKKTGVPVGEGV